MAEDSKGGGGAGVTIVVALIGVVGVLGAAYISSQPKPSQHPAYHSPNDPTPSSPAQTNPPVSTQPAYMGALVPNTSYSGGDVAHLQLGSPAACASACLARSDCRSMTFDGNAGVCWLKGSVPQGLYGPNFTSAIKQGG
jgi:hypothetical protein